MPGGIRKGAGRKATPIDLIALEKLSSLQCTDEEIAAWFSVSVRTIETRRKQPRFAEAMNRGKARGRISVRRAQWRLLEAGNGPIAVWLGKHLLGQKDTVQITGANGGPIRTEGEPDFSVLSVDELRVLRAVLARVNDKTAPELT
jgi:hypothetical protein